MSIYSKVEDIYGSLMLDEEELCFASESLYDEIVCRHTYLYKQFNKEEINEAICYVIKRVTTDSIYSRKLILRHIIKKIYLDLIHLGYDPDDPTFEQMLSNIAIGNSYISTHMFDNQRSCSAVQDFLHDVNHGLVDVPVTKPYLNYVPTNCANDILSKHKLLVEPQVKQRFVPIDLNEPVVFD